MPLSSHTVQRNPSLKGQVYQVIRTSILSGEFAAGERLIETQLSKKLQVSRTPIREALRQLQQEGLVVEGENNLLQVVRFSVDDAIQLYDCRLALEKLSVAQACSQITLFQLQNLHVLLIEAKQLSQTPSLSQLTHFQMLDLDYRFHRLLAEGSGNLWLRSLLDQVFDKMIVIRVRTLQQNPQVLNIYSEHERIYEAVKQRKVEEATRSIIDHLKEAQERVAEEMRKIAES